MAIKKFTNQIKYSKGEISRIVNDAYNQEELKDFLESQIKILAKR